MANGWLIRGYTVHVLAVTHSAGPVDKLRHPLDTQRVRLRY